MTILVIWQKGQWQHSPMAMLFLGTLASVDQQTTVSRNVYHIMRVRPCVWARGTNKLGPTRKILPPYCY